MRICEIGKEIFQVWRSGAVSGIARKCKRYQAFALIVHRAGWGYDYPLHEFFIHRKSMTASFEELGLSQDLLDAVMIWA